MILPGKHLKLDRSLLGLGSEIIGVLDEQRTVSEIWKLVQQRRAEHANPLSFDWFILALSFLFTIGVVRLDNSVVARVSPE